MVTVIDIFYNILLLLWERFFFFVRKNKQKGGLSDSLPVLSSEYWSFFLKGVEFFPIMTSLLTSKDW